MSKRLQVLVPEEEYREIQEAARREGMTVSEWVRHAMRSSRRDRSTDDVARRLAAIRRAYEHRFPVPDSVDEMNEEIARGYLDNAYEPPR